MTTTVIFKTASNRHPDMYDIFPGSKYYKKYAEGNITYRSWLERLGGKVRDFSYFEHSCTIDFETEEDAILFKLKYM